MVGGTNYITKRAGDGVNFLATAPGVIGTDITANGIALNFPFLPTRTTARTGVTWTATRAGPGANPCGALVP